jgi:PKD repeat protein
LNAQENELSTDPTAASLIKPSDQLVFSPYHLNPIDNIELDDVEELRAYYNQNYYFKFTMPQTKDVSAVIQFPENMTAGMAAYVEEGSDMVMVDKTQLNNAEGSLEINHSEVSSGQEVLVRMWFSESISGNTIQIGLVKKDPLLFPKAINVVTEVYTPQELVEDFLVTGCLQAFNVTFNGDPISIGYFTGNIGTSGYDEGIILSTGDAGDAAGPDESTSTSSNLGGGTDPDLSALNPGYSTNDVAVLEFDFIPATDELVFDFIFGSEEFHIFADGNYNDIFGFFLSGPGIDGPYTNDAINIALLPNGIPVTINNVYNTAYYYGSTYANTASGQAYNNDIEYNGATIPLTATAAVQACETYHIKLAIGDAGDSAYDSGVFLRAGSFTSGATFTPTVFNPWYSTNEVYEGCENYLVFTRLDENSLDTEIEIPLEIGGTATMGVDYDNLPSTFTIPAGQVADTLVVNIFEDGIVEGDETITFTFSDGCPCENDNITLTVDVFDEIDWVPTLSNTGPICQGETATISFTPPPGLDFAIADWVWTHNNSSAYSLEVTPDETTTYTLEWTHPCETIEYTTTVEVIPPPDIDLGDDLEIPGYETTLDAGMDEGNTGSWEIVSGPGTGVFGDENASETSLVVDELGIYEIVWSEVSLPPDCGSSDTLFIEFYHVPTAEFTISESLCFGDELTVEYVGSAYDWADYDWDFGDAIIVSGSGQGPYVITYDSPGDYDISLTVTELDVVVDETNSVLVPEDIAHQLTTNDDPCFNSCGGSAEVVVTGGTMPYTYSWESGTNTLNDLCAGDYTITVTDSNGCSTAQSFVINQPSEIVYDTNITHVDCFGNSTGSAGISVTGGSAPYTYEWSNGSASSEISSVTAGVYQVSVYDAHDCMITETFVINEPDQLTMSFSDDMSVCYGQSVNLMAIPTGGTLPYTVYWSVNGGPFTINPEVQSVSPEETSNYSAYVVDANGCESSVHNMTMTVSPQIVLDLETVDNLCAESCDGSAELTVTGGIPPFDYTWASDNRVLEDLCSGMYEVSVIDNVGCFSDTVFFIDEPSELFYNTSTESASCPGVNDGIASVEAGGGTTPYSYLWSNGSMNSSIQVSEGTYSLTITDANGCRETTSVEVDAPQQMQIIPGPVFPICIGGTAMLTAEVLGGTAPYDFVWQGEDGAEGFDHQFTVSPENDTDYQLTVTDQNGCMISYHDFTVEVNPPLEILSISLDQDTVCANSPIRVFVDVEGGNGGPYTLQLQDGQIVGSSFTIYPEEAQTLEITLTDECETPSVTESIYIPVWPLPENNFVSNVVEGCPPLLVEFNELHANTGINYQWAFGDNSFGFGYNSSHVYNEPGVYDVGLTIRNQFGCKTTTVIEDMIEVFPTPDVDFYANPNEASIVDPQIQFTGISEFADSLYWYFGDGDSSIWQVSDPIHSYNAKGEYGVTLVGENSFGCTDTAFKFVSIIDEPTFWTPNIFTPNGDGDNDCFRLCGNSIDPSGFYLAIYTRWGEQVFETEYYDPTADCDQCGDGAWDGTFEGAPGQGLNGIQPGIYVWFATYTDSFGTVHESSGYVRLAQ